MCKCQRNYTPFNGFRLAAAQEAAAQHRAGRDWSTLTAMGNASQLGSSVEKAAPGPSSLFIFSENNAIRRYTRFIIDWPYPLAQLSFIKRNFMPGKLLNYDSYVGRTEGLGKEGRRKRLPSIKLLKVFEQM